MNLISSEYLESFSLGCQINWQEVESKIKAHSNASYDELQKFLKESAYYSSLIDDSKNGISLNQNEFNLDAPELPKEIQDLYDAYYFAYQHPLNKSNFLRSFEILSSTLLPEKLHGRFREKHIVDIDYNASEIPLYVAVEPENVEKTFIQLFEDIQALQDQDLTIQEVFYYASVIHLWLAKIHPFPGANCVAARLLEKWFLFHKLGPCAWCIESEKYYFENQEAYRQNLSLGFNFYALFWERCIPFLLMLPDAFEFSSENKSIS